MPRLAKSSGIDTRSLPLGAGLAVLGQRAGRLDLFGHLARVLEQAGAEFGQHQAARGPLQQALAQAALRAARCGARRSISAGPGAAPPC